MDFETEIITFKLKELLPGGLRRLADRLTDVASFIASKLRPFGVTVNYIDLIGDELKVSITREVPETSASIFPAILIPLIPVIIRGILWLTGVIVVSWSVKNVVEDLTGSEQESAVIDYCREMGLPPDQCKEMLDAIDSTGINWSTIMKIALGAGVILGGFLIARSLYGGD